MTHPWKLAIVCGMVLAGAFPARAQGVAPATLEQEGPLPGGNNPASLGLPTADQLDFSVLSPVDTGVFDVNGVTDRFGMPIGGEFVKGSAAGATVSSGTPAATSGPARRSTAARTKAATKRDATSKREVSKTKDARRTNRMGTSTAGAAPQYYVPHGSLDWAPGGEAISTSPSSPYGYGHGTSGYGTEVFGDFWKGWPIVQ